MVKQKLAILFFLILLLGLNTVACSSQEKISELEGQLAELNLSVQEQQELLQQKEGEIAEKEEQLSGLSGSLAELVKEKEQLANQLGEKDAQLAATEQEKSELEQELEFLLASSVAPQVEVVATISANELSRIIREYYPNTSYGVSGSSFQLISRATLEDFLANYNIFFPQSRETAKDLCDELPYRLKVRLFEAGFPNSALGFLKGERVLPSGRSGLLWINVFVTKEDGKFVVYEVIPKYKLILKVEEPNYNTYVVRFSSVESLHYLI